MFLLKQEKVHKNALAHGWWEDDRGNMEIMALVISELSELLEAYRENSQDKPCDKDIGIDQKSEELADVVIRVMDYRGKLNDESLNLYLNSDRQKMFNNLSGISIGSQIGLLMSEVVKYFNTMHGLDMIIAYCEEFANLNQVDLWAAVAVKHEYNKTRPYKHGKQF